MSLNKNLIMKKPLHTSFVILPILIIFCFAQCKKEHAALNITLYDKPLGTIQSYIQGKWKLHYAKGGICGSCIFPARNNQYIKLSSDRIVFGNDSAGIVLDTIIYWKRDKDIFNDSTYLLTYYYPAGAGPFPIAYIVNGIYNDTLKLIDNAYDPIYYYYTK